MEQSQSLTRRGLARIKSVLRRAKWVLFWERLWPALFSFVMLVMVYASLSWLGVWVILPIWLKIIALCLFAFAACFILLRGFRLQLPEIDEAVDRVESVSGVSHRPLTASLDQPAGDNGALNSPQNALWHAHQSRIQDQLSKLKAGWPNPFMQKHDPYALRAVVILTTVIAFNVAGGERWLRLKDGFDFTNAGARAVARLDAWVTPPRYTGKPPIFLTKERLDSTAGPIVVPSGSLLTIRSVNADALLVTFARDNEESVAIAAKSKEGAAEGGTQAPETNQTDYELKLDESGTVSIGKTRGSHEWVFDVVPDNPPIIGFVDTPKPQYSGALQIIAALKDDYGVTRADTLIELIESKRARKARPLYEAPQFPLTLRRGQIKDGVSKTLRSLVDHPWAGAEISMTLQAFDEAGQKGLSEALTFHLPTRRFLNPLARAIIEQRRALALDGNYKDKLVDVIDVLTIRPEQYENNYAAFIALAAVRRGLLDARNDDALRKIVDDLWDLAIGIEDGELSDAERRLKDALQALRDGIRNGAPEEELARLIDEAREALNEFMQALAEQALKNPDTAQNQPPFDPSQTLDSQDLQEMLSRIQELAETGSKDAAEQVLSQLQQLMENLQAQNQQGQQGQNQAREALNELGEMIRRQQQLLDETFRQERGSDGDPSGREPGEGEGQGERQGQGEGQREGQQQGQGQGQGESQGEKGQGLQQGQGQLADRLQRFIEGLEEGISDPSGQLGQAQRSMRGAAEQLGDGDLGRAGEEQTKALNELRAGAQALAEQLAGEGQEQGEGLGRAGRTDPLGRRDGGRDSSFGEDVEVPDEIDVQRAREILDAIRKRLGETLRPQIELDYLERLLRSE